jgi:hypothetical protein
MEMKRRERINSQVERIEWNTMKRAAMTDMLSEQQLAGTFLFFFDRPEKKKKIKKKEGRQ